MFNRKKFISIEKIKKKEEQIMKEIQDDLNKGEVITTEWLTYEELDRRTKKILPALDESKIKTFLIEPFFYKLDKKGLIKQQKLYYER